MVDMVFKRNEQREAVGRIRWEKLKSSWGLASGTEFEPSDFEPTLVNYFRKELGRASDPSTQPHETVFGVGQGRWGDGVYRKFGGEVDWDELVVKWSGPGDPSWMELTYERQCETVDMLPRIIEHNSLGYEDPIDARAQALLADGGGDAEVVLIDLLQQNGLWEPVVAQLKAAAKVIAYRSWCSAYYEHHAQSIEGDYELFDAFEAQWLEAQGKLPRHWTRQALNGLSFYVQELVEDGSAMAYTLLEIRAFIVEERAAGRIIPDCPYPSKEEWRMATAFVGLLDSDHFEPTLADFFQ